MICAQNADDGVAFSLQPMADDDENVDRLKKVVTWIDGLRLKIEKNDMSEKEAEAQLRLYVECARCTNALCTRGVLMPVMCCCIQICAHFCSLHICRVANCVSARWL